MRRQRGGEERRGEAYLDTDLAVALRANEFLHALLHDLRFDERGNHCCCYCFLPPSSSTIRSEQGRKKKDRV